MTDEAKMAVLWDSRQEIDQLRAEVERFREQNRKHHIWHGELQAEIERLRHIIHDAARWLDPEANGVTPDVALAVLRTASRDDPNWLEGRVAAAVLRLAGEVADTQAALEKIRKIAAREWKADETNYEWYGDIAGIAEEALGERQPPRPDPTPLPPVDDDHPFFSEPTVGHCSRCGEARLSFYTCRDGGSTVPTEAASDPIARVLGPEPEPDIPSSDVVRHAAGEKP